MAGSPSRPPRGIRGHGGRGDAVDRAPPPPQQTEGRSSPEVDREAEAWGRLLHPQGDTLSSERAKEIGAMVSADLRRDAHERQSVHLLLDRSIDILLSEIKRDLLELELELT